MNTAFVPCTPMSYIRISVIVSILSLAFCSCANRRELAHAGGGMPESSAVSAPRADSAHVTSVRKVNPILSTSRPEGAVQQVVR
jgi:hypothetical protein